MFFIFINGKKFLISSSCTIMELVEFLGLKKSLIILEYNKMVLPNIFWPNTFLYSCDCLEFVTIVGGG